MNYLWAAHWVLYFINIAYFIYNIYWARHLNKEWERILEHARENEENARMNAVHAEAISAARELLTLVKQ